MKDAATTQKPPRAYQKHGDLYRQNLLKDRGVEAIDGRTRAGRKAKLWLKTMLEKKGGKSCPIGTREKIEAGAFYLWRALAMRSYIVADARNRGTPINKRRGTLPSINEQYDTAINQWQRINDELELDKPMDLARRLMVESKIECGLDSVLNAIEEYRRRNCTYRFDAEPLINVPISLLLRISQDIHLNFVFTSEI